MRMTHEPASVSRRAAFVTAAGVALTLQAPEKGSRIENVLAVATKTLQPACGLCEYTYIRVRRNVP